MMTCWETEARARQGRSVLAALAVALILAVGAPVARAEQVSRAEAGRLFTTWVNDVVWPRARAEGVTRDVFTRAFKGVALNWDLPDLVPPGASAPPRGAKGQAEFGAPARYFTPQNLLGSARTGRDMANRHKAALARTTARTGVPGHIILAIWGRESAYGRAKIPHDAIEVLATKGFMSTRAAYFTDELVAALGLLQSGLGGPGRLKSSWAGALGQPQFMPSSVRAYASDGNGDGRADIFGSEADVIASIGTYLQRHGWVAGRDWGFEVTLPAEIPCHFEGPDQGRPIREWEAMGLTRVSGRPFPEHERDKIGFLMLPAGRLGPAFVVTPNFFVIKDYNMSDLYALFVGHVGDRIAYGQSDFAARWQPIDKLLRADVAAMQRVLVAAGHDVGGVDGLAGFKTRRSLGRWQAAQGLAPTCFPSRALLARMTP